MERLTLHRARRAVIEAAKLDGLRMEVLHAYWVGSPAWERMGEAMFRVARVTVRELDGGWMAVKSVSVDSNGGYRVA